MDIENILIDLNNDNNNIEKHESQEQTSNYIKYIIFIIGAFFILGLTIFLIYFNSDFPIVSALQDLRNIVDDETFNQIKQVVLKMLREPEKRAAGLNLLELLKLTIHPRHLLKDNPQEFEKMMTHLIKILISIFKEDG